MSQELTVKFYPGQVCLISGLYGVVNALGYRTGRQVKVVKGAPFPQGFNPGYTYVLDQPIK